MVYLNNRFLGLTVKSPPCFFYGSFIYFRKSFTVTDENALLCLEMGFCHQELRVTQNTGYEKCSWVGHPHKHCMVM